MEPKSVDLDQWLMKKMVWMVEETSAYMDTRELLALCQTVALIRLNQTLQKINTGHELAGVRKALVEQAAALTGLIKQQQPTPDK
jgi:hypothetical protein